MDKVKRYHVGLNHSEFLGMKEAERGNYVTYDDYQRDVELARKQGYKEAEDAAEYWRTH